MRIIGRAITMALALAVGSACAANIQDEFKRVIDESRQTDVSVRRSRATPRWRPAGRASAGATCGPASRNAHATCGSGCAT